MFKFAKARAAINSVNPNFWYKLYLEYWEESNNLYFENELLKQYLQEAEKRLKDAGL